MDTKKSIKATEDKTYAYLLSVLIGPLILDVIYLVSVFCYDVIEYLRYHNDFDDHGGKLEHYVNLREIPLYGILGFIFSCLLVIGMRSYVKRIRNIEKKRIPIIISIGIMIVSFVILGIVSFVLLDLFIGNFH